MTSGATPDFKEVTCNSISEDVRGVWYEYEAAEKRIVNVAISNPSFLYRIAIFRGDSCDAPACIDFYDTSPVPFQVEQAEKYFILVTGRLTGSDDVDFGNVGTFSISITVRHIFKKNLFNSNHSSLLNELTVHACCLIINLVIFHRRKISLQMIHVTMQQQLTSD